MSSQWIKAVDCDVLRQQSKTVVRADGKQIVLFHTDDGIFACNNRCPHEDYPLWEGTLDGACVLTCNWHNWKFDLKTGANIYDGDRLRIFPVEVRGNEIWIDVRDPPFEDRRADIMTNVRRAFDDHDLGLGTHDRLAREVERLRLLGADPLDVVIAAIEWSYDRLEFVWTHAYAGAADWLTLYDERGDEPQIQLICLLEAVGHIAYDVLREKTYPFTERKEPFDEDALVRAIEGEDEDSAIAIVRGALDDGLGFDDLERALTRAALAHYYDFGHSLIYVTKARQLIERLGERVTLPLLLSLVRDVVFATREDQIPEFRGYADALGGWGRKSNGAAPTPDTYHGLNAGGRLTSPSNPAGRRRSISTAACWQRMPGTCSNSTQAMRLIPTVPSRTMSVGSTSRTP